MGERTNKRDWNDLGHAVICLFLGTIFLGHVIAGGLDTIYVFVTAGLATLGFGSGILALLDFLRPGWRNANPP